MVFTICPTQPKLSLLPMELQIYATRLPTKAILSIGLGQVISTMSRYQKLFQLKINKHIQLTQTRTHTKKPSICEVAGERIEARNALFRTACS